MARLALSTSCGAENATLPEIVDSFRELGVAAIALHRPPDATELRALAVQARRVPVVALFGDPASAPPGIPLVVIEGPLVVIEGGPAPADPAARERALEELCRRLHAIQGPALALRTPRSEDEFPAPMELPLLREALPRVGYWHDVARGGDEFLDACGGALRGASFDPLATAELVGVRDALADRAPAVVALAPGSGSAMVREALAYARSMFGE